MFVGCFAGCLCWCVGVGNWERLVRLEVGTLVGTLVGCVRLYCGSQSLCDLSAMSVP